MTTWCPKRGFRMKIIQSESRGLQTSSVSKGGQLYESHIDFIINYRVVPKLSFSSLTLFYCRFYLLQAVKGFIDPLIIYMKPIWDPITSTMCIVFGLKVYNLIFISQTNRR